MRTISYSKLSLLILLAAVALGGCAKGVGLQIGDTVPNVTLTGLQGKSVTLPKDIKGKVALLRFWSIDCGFCDKETLLSLESLYQKYHELGFIPLAVNASRLDSTDERLKMFNHLTYPMLVDEYGLVAKRFGVIGLPTTFIIDEQGRVRDKFTGETDSEELEKRLTTILYKGVFYESGH